MKTLIGLLVPVLLCLAFAIHHGFCRGERQQPQDFIGISTPAPTLDYEFVYDELVLMGQGEFESGGVTITPHFITLHAADESTGLLFCTLAYASIAAPPFMLKAISFAYYPELGKCFAFPHDGAEESVLWSYLESISYRQEVVDLSFYPRRSK